jgi:serine/threonine-protein kinase
MPEVADNTIVDGRYRITGRIGSGGMADVYSAEDTHLGREVAIKVLYRRFAQDAEFVERFRREAKSAAGLQHPNVVNVFDRGEHDGTYYIAMEHLRGQTLKAVVSAEAPLAEVRAIDIGIQILRAAGFAHRRGVIHRDFKPHNVICDDADGVKVTDFGIARAGASEMTETGSIMGTAQYLSPEQAQGHGVTAESDLYSIAVVLYEMLSGRVPFEGDSAVSIALKHLNDPPPALSVARPGIHPALEAVVMRGLAKQPSQRFAGADEFIAALEEVRRQIQSGEAQGQDTMLFGPPVVATEEAPAAPATSAGKPRRRRRAPFAVLLLVLLALGAVAAFALTRAEEVSVPDVVGQTLLQASTRLEDAGFEVRERRVRDQAPQDEVIRQDPRSGIKADEGSTITLFVSDGPGEARVPSVEGRPEEEAVEELNEAGFQVTTDEQASDEFDPGIAIRTVPDGGELADRGSRIRLFVSTGPEKVEVPTVTGSTESSAEARLERAGLLVDVEEEASQAEEGTVIRQDPAGGTEVDEGTRVTIVVSSGRDEVAVPDVTGQTLRDARAELRDAGFRVQVRDQSVEDEAQDGLVVDQRPNGGTDLAEGRTVVVFVGRFTEPTPKDEPPAEPGATP